MQFFPSEKITSALEENSRIEARLAALDKAEAAGEDAQVAPRRIYGTDDIPGGYAWVRDRLRQTHAANEAWIAKLRAES